MINLSRNTPVAVVWGAAGFLGSHVAEKLLDKGVQVVGVDNLTTGDKENLIDSSKSKLFHLIASFGSKVDLVFPRLDYAVFVVGDKIPYSQYLSSFETFLDLCSNWGEGGIPKIILVSSVELYEQKEGVLPALREAERRLAKFALEKGANARIVRLVAVYGPRMHFTEDDPIVSLLQAAVRGEIQKQVVSLDFTTRSLYVDDAVNLIIKALFHGATAQKIYDGALLSPVKVAEVKQVLLDPIWHEVKRFTPTELPPWPTPNLEKTQKELSWKPVATVVEGLKKTLAYFREYSEKVPAREEAGSHLQPRLPAKTDTAPAGKPASPLTSFTSNKEFKKLKKCTGLLVGLALIMYALVYPLVALAFGGLSIRYHLKQANEAAVLGQFDQARGEVALAQGTVREMREFMESVSLVKAVGLFNRELGMAETTLEALDQSVAAVRDLAFGTQYLYQALGVMSGEQGEEVGKIMQQAEVELAAAEAGFGNSLARLSDPAYLRALDMPSGGLPYREVKKRVEDLATRLQDYQKSAGQGRTASSILPQMLGYNGAREYLVLLQNNLELRPGGGVVAAYARVVFINGRLAEVEADSVDRLDSAFKEKITPPQEVKSDLGQSSWYLKDVSFDPDFPTNARQAQWFYHRMRGVKTFGVVSVDVDAASALLEAVGAVEVPGGKVDSENVYKLMEEHSKDREYLKALYGGLLKQVFFAAKQDWPQISQAIGSSLAAKHMSVYLTEPALFALANSNGWSATFPRRAKEAKGEREEFLALSEANVGGTAANINLKRQIKLETNISQDNIVTNKLAVGYSLLDGSSRASLYKNRLKVYLAPGSKLTYASFGGQDITKQVSSQTDYGRAVYSLLLTVDPREEKELVLQYQDGKPLEFVQGQVKYRLDVVKQPGTGRDQFDFKLMSEAGEGKEMNFSADLAQDRSFEVVLTK